VKNIPQFLNEIDKKDITISILLVSHKNEIFQAPQPAEPWEGIRDALVEGGVAPQTGIFVNNTYGGDEDCLFINVFTPKVTDWSSSQLEKNAFTYEGKSETKVS
jgi:hypothetical protein